MFLFNKPCRGENLSDWIQWCQRLWAVVDALERRFWMIWWPRCARFGVWSIGHLQNRSASACQHFISKLFRRPQIWSDLSSCFLQDDGTQLMVNWFINNPRPPTQTTNLPSVEVHFCLLKTQKSIPNLHGFRQNSYSPPLSRPPHCWCARRCLNGRTVDPQKRHCNCRNDSSCGS